MLTPFIVITGQGILNNERTVKSMLAVDRKNYAKGNAYQDAPQTIGYGVTISAPHMVIFGINDLFSDINKLCS